ncbi:MAG: dimethylarginine dimethylaminohydrolase family protein [Acidimicrobiales bacterium]
MAELTWGRRYLMCRPEHFGVVYEINPWMHAEIRVDRDRAQLQWDALVATIEAAGATVALQPPQPELPDLVFTANAGIVNGRQFIPARFRHPERRGESPHDIEWFASRGYDIAELPTDVFHEGAGDALPFDGVLVSGYRFRSDASAHPHVSRLTGAPVRSVELVDPRLYHVDLTFCPLDDRRALIAPSGWDHYGSDVVRALVPEPIVLEEDEAHAFCANSVVVGGTVIMPTCPVRVGRMLEAAGFTPVECDVSEFVKAGGACRCLTLALDVELTEAKQLT